MCFCLTDYLLSNFTCGVPYRRAWPCGFLGPPRYSTVTIRHLEVYKTWYILGDFNVVRKMEERRGVNIDGNSKKEISEFHKFIEKIEMFDIPLVGRKYTWYKPNGSAKSRIDRILTSFEWFE